MAGSLIDCNLPDGAAQELLHAGVASTTSPEAQSLQRRDTLFARPEAWVVWSETTATPTMVVAIAGTRGGLLNLATALRHWQEQRPHHEPHSVTFHGPKGDVVVDLAEAADDLTVLTAAQAAFLG